MSHANGTLINLRMKSYKVIFCFPFWQIGIKFHPICRFGTVFVVKVLKGRLFSWTDARPSLDRRSFAA